jgi:transcriptional regulator with XRE-family HTH domain
MRDLRKSKHWTQEDMAEKLEMSTNGYGSIERGETDVTLSRLIQIAKAHEVELLELFGGTKKNENNVFNMTGTGTCNTNTQIGVGSVSMEQTELKHELEKARLIIERQEQENAYLKKIISLMEEEKGQLLGN